MVSVSYNESHAEIDLKGAHLSALFLGGKDIIKPSMDGAPTHGGGAVLIPYGGRVRNAVYTYDGTTYSLPRNNGSNSIHGFLKDIEWMVDEEKIGEVTLSCDLEREDYPSSLHTVIRFSVSEKKFINDTVVTNTGNNYAPLVIGFHPYFITGESWTLRYTNELRKLNFVDGYFPDGTTEEVDYTSLDDMSRMEFDNCFYGGGIITLLGETHSIRITRENMDYLVIYNGSFAEGKSVALEPMTGAPDAFNNGIGLTNLAPGKRYECGYTVELLQEP